MHKKVLLSILLGFLFLTLIGFTLLIFNRQVNSHMAQDMDVRLHEIVQPNLTSFALQTNEQIKKVKTFAQFLGENGDLNTASSVALLQSAVEHNDLLRCAIAFPDGSFITHDSKNKGNVLTDPFFVESMKGNFFISDPRPAVVDPSKTVMLFACPIYQEDKIIGSVIYSYLCDDMDQIFNLTFMNNQGRMAVIKKDGTMLMGNWTNKEKGNNVLTQLKEYCTHTKHLASSCMNITTTNGNWRITAPDGSSALYCRYDALPFNDWYMLSVIPEKTALKTLTYITGLQRNFSFALFGYITLYMIVLLFIWLTHRQMIDKTTGVLTLIGFKKKATKVIQQASGQRYVLIQLDVKDFKLINRIYNFSMGDLVIRNIALSLNFALKDLNAIVARTGVDTFLVFLPYNGSDWLLSKRNVFIKDFQKRMGERFSTRINFPTGQHILTADEMNTPDINSLIEKVNFAHRAAKQKYNTIIDYADCIEKEMLLEKKIEDRMLSALTDDEFTLYLQPKFCLIDESICGAEALVRWKVDGEYYMYPTDFIPILERNGFIVQLDKYMFELAVKKIKKLLDVGHKPLKISVNFSRHHLNNENFVTELCAIADKYKVPHSYLEIELTESAVFGNINKIIELINEIHMAGFTMSLDDFGSGYSSLAQLKDLHVDVLKIDKGFFDDTNDLHRARIVLDAIFQMAQNLGITTVAEGIETREQVDIMKDLQCDIIQGYYFAKPMHSDLIDELLTK